MERAYERAEFRVWTRHFKSWCNGLDRERRNGLWLYPPLSVPGPELFTAARVHDRAESHPRVCRSTHRAVFAGRVHGGQGAFLGREVFGGPPRDREFRVARMVSPCDAIAVSKSHHTGLINQDGPKGLVARGKCFSGQVHALLKELTIFVTERS